MTVNEKAAEAAKAKAAHAAALRQEVQARSIRDGVDRRAVLDGLDEAESEHLQVAHAHEDQLAAARRQATARAQIAADDISLLRGKLADVRDGAVTRAAGRLIESGGRLDDQSFEAMMRAVRQAAGADKLAEDLGRLEVRQRARVSHEPGPYGAGSPYSWIRDRLACAESTIEPRHAGAADRLARHGRDVAREVARGSEYGKRARAVLIEGLRREDAAENERQVTAELRALTTGGGASASASSGGAAFVPPAIVMEAWAEYRSPYAALAGQCDDSVELPPYGMEVYLPRFTTGTTVSTQTEGSSVAEGDPVANYDAAAIVSKSGQITASQQVLDRVGPGITGDVLLWQQLKNQLAAQVDAYVIAEALSGAGSVTNSGSFALAGTSGVGGFLGDLKTAKNSLHDTAGTRVRATHLFAIGDFVDYITAYADAQGRPVFLPTLDDNRLPIRSTGDPMAEGFSGYVISGLALFADDNIPNASSNAQIVVARPDTILLLAAEPVPYLYPEGAAGNLEAIIGVRRYVTAVPRYPAAVNVISGAAYQASNFA